MEREPLPARTVIGADRGASQRIALSRGTLDGAGRRTAAANGTCAVSRSRKGGSRDSGRIAALHREADRDRVRSCNDCHKLTTALVRHCGAIATSHLERASARTVTREIVARPSVK